MTNHFIRSTRRGEAVKVSRVGTSAWTVSIPLPGEISGSLSQFDTTFGYPIDFACWCSSKSTDSCSCAHESVYAFWNCLSTFVCDFADSSGQAASIESLRRRFVQFYIDLPLWHLTYQGNQRVSASDYRQELIEDAERVYRKTDGTGKSLPWLPWPKPNAELTEDETAELFSGDVSVLSIIRSVIGRNFSSASAAPSPVGDLLAGMSGSQVLQLGSVLDQLNLSDLSADVLAFYLENEPVFVACNDELVTNTFTYRINNTLSNKNRMKNKFFSKIVAPTTKMTFGDNLDKFRDKLAKMLLFKRAGKASTLEREYTPLSSTSPNLRGDESPVDHYCAARRSLTPVASRQSATSVSLKDAVSNAVQTTQLHLPFPTKQDLTSRLHETSSRQQNSPPKAGGTVVCERSSIQQVTPRQPQPQSSPVVTSTLVDELTEPSPAVEPVHAIPVLETMHPPASFEPVHSRPVLKSVYESPIPTGIRPTRPVVAKPTYESPVLRSIQVPPLDKNLVIAQTYIHVPKLVPPDSDPGSQRSKSSGRRTTPRRGRRETPPKVLTVGLAEWEATASADLDKINNY